MRAGKTQLLRGSREAKGVAPGADSMREARDVEARGGAHTTGRCGGEEPKGQRTSRCPGSGL